MSAAPSALSVADQKQCSTSATAYVDIKKSLPFMELEQNIQELDDEEVVFKSRVKYQTAIFKNQKFRGSKYRGVSRNGKLW